MSNKNKKYTRRDQNRLERTNQLVDLELDEQTEVCNTVKTGTKKGQHLRDQQVEHIYCRVIEEENETEQETASPGGFHCSYTRIYIILGAK